jgi:hypothetical protein
MAGPFAPVNQQEIGATRLTATELPKSRAEATGVADAVIKSAGDLIQQNTQKQIKAGQDKLERSLENVTDALEVFRFGDDDDVARLENAAKQGDPIARDTLEEFRAIQSAKVSGKLPSDAAALRVRSILKRSVNAAPEFEAELRAAARKSLGFSPEAETSRRLLREPKRGPLTAEQKRLQEREADLNEIMETQTVTRQQAEQILNQATKLAFDSENAKNALTLGEFSAANVQAHANAAGAVAMQRVFGQIGAQLQQNGGVYDVNAAKGIVLTTIAQLKAEALSGLSDPRQTGQILSNFNALQKDMLAMVENSSVGQRAGDFISTMRNQFAAGVMLDRPELGAWMALPNADALVKVIELSNKFAGNEKLMTALGFGGTTQISAFGAEQVKNLPKTFRESMRRMIAGEPATSEQDAQVRAWGSQQLVKDPTVDTQLKQKALSDIIETNGAFTAITALDDSGVIGQIIADAALSRQAANLINTNIEASHSRVLAAQDVPGATLSIEDNQFVLELPPVGELTGGLLDQATELRTAVQQFNRIQQVNDKYVLQGVTNKFNIQEQEQPQGEAVAPADTFIVDITEAATQAGFVDKPDGIYVDINGNRIAVRNGRVFREQ